MRFFTLLLAIILAAIAGVTTANPIVAKDINFGGPQVQYCCVNYCRICSWTDCPCSDSVSRLILLSGSSIC
jgi:hypothetical protein